MSQQNMEHAARQLAEGVSGKNLALIAVQRVEVLARGGAHLDQRIFAVQEFRDGKVLRMRTYPSRLEALEAVGLSQ